MSEDMTEEQVIHDLSDAAQNFSGLIKAIKLLIVGAFVMGGWVATLEIRQRWLWETVEANHETILEDKVWKAKVENTRWTVGDHAKWAQADRDRESKVMTALAEKNRLTELRMQRLEDTQQRLQETQSKIQAEIREKLRVTPAEVLEEVRKLRDSQ